MDIIKNYLESMFVNLPKNQEMDKLKEDLYNNMEDKYMELKAEGKSENEAIGMVISNFGNIDELLAELGVKTGKEETAKLRTIGLNEAETIIKEKKFWGKFIAFGVTLCILAPAILIFVASTMNNFSEKEFDLLFGKGMIEINDATGVVSLIPFFLFIACGVGILIFAGLMLSKYEFLEKEIFEISTSAKTFVQQKKDANQMSFTLHMVIGIVLCILSPMALITIAALKNNLSGGSIGVCVLLMFVAVAVFMFISAGVEMSTYKQLLQEEDYKPENKKESKVIEAAASIVWPLTVIVYLAWSFITNDWGITWIIWPIVGITFGMFSGFVKTIQK